MTRTDPSLIQLNRYRMKPDLDRHFEAALDGNDARLLVGGFTFFTAVADDLARVGPAGFVYLASWNCEVDLGCFPGGETLRAKLAHLAGTGTEVRMQLWAANPITGAVGPLRYHPLVGLLASLAQRQFKPAVNNAVAVAAVNAMPGGFGFLDDQHATFGSHHQKIIVVHTGTELVAYVGGVEFTDDRLFHVSNGAPLFDVSVRITGPGAQRILTTFAERWAAHPTGAANPLKRVGLAASGGPGGSVRIQVGHTYAAGFPFAGPIRTASELTAQAILTSRKYFYMEDQYFVGDPLLTAAIMTVLARKDVSVLGIVVIAAEDSVGDLPDVGFRRRAFIGPIVAANPGRFLVFEAVGDDGTSIGDRAYVHSKLTLVDDEALLIGSMNSSRRSWTHDSEVSASLVDVNGPAGTGGAPGFAKATRIELWQRHLRGIWSPPVPIEPLGEALGAWTTAATGTPGLAVRPYPPAGSVAVRPWLPLSPIASALLQDPLLDLYWDVADPR
ncbi:MAG: hypothetical protein M3065_00930 [Actinomycetota bacterium]|nr:hypothetical protein [Actinomycetota bacterium]